MYLARIMCHIELFGIYIPLSILVHVCDTIRCLLTKVYLHIVMHEMDGFRNINTNAQL